MRKVPVDLSRYLPKFLYQDPTFAQLQSALNIEHESYRLKLVDLAKQFFVQTADSDGLNDWQKFLKITPRKNADVELRRSVVAVKRRGGVVLTLENAKQLMREFLRFENEDTEVGIEELGENKLKLILTNGDFYWEELMAALWEQLPAHLIFDMSIFEDFGEEYVTFAQATADASFDFWDLDMLSPPPENILVGNFVVDISTDTFYPDSSDEHSNHTQDLQVAILTLESEHTTFDCDRAELDDEETREDFERYIRERWLKFKTNPIVRWYKHGTHGDDYDGETDDGNEEFFPVDTSFLRIYWQFDCPYDSDGAGGKNYHLRYQTILQPKEPQAKDINYLSEVGKSSKMLLHSKLQIPSSGIIRALYVKKSDIKII